MNPLMMAMKPKNLNVMQIASILGSGNPEQAALRMIQNNPRLQGMINQYKDSPEFKAFMDKNRGKSPEQVARENGLM